MRSAFLWAVPLTILAAAGSARAHPSFTFIEPDAGYSYSVVQDVAKGARMVLVSLQNISAGPVLKGYTLDLATGTRTYLIDPLGSDLIPTAISGNGGVVAGSLGGGPLADVNAFVWDRAVGNVVNIGGLAGGNLSYATGVSGDGSVVVGTTGANFGDPYQQGWRWTGEDGFTALDDIGDDILIFGSAEDISADGSTVVGTGSVGDYDPDTDDISSGAIWPAGGTTPTNLGNLPSPIITGGLLPTAASADGSVVVGFGPGFGDDGSTFANRSFRWTQAAGLVDIGSVPGRPNGSVHITDCSSDGNTLVGYSTAGGVNTWEAVVWTADTGLRTLRSILVERGVVIPANIALRETYCNGEGTIIAGWAYDIAINRYRGYIAEIPPECHADFNGDGFVDLFDFDEFVSCFEGEVCPPGRDSDFNGDGFTDLFDYDDFVVAFDRGC